MKRDLAVIGAGPMGVEAALYAAELGYRVTVYEAATVGANMLTWGHARMFSPWSLNMSTLGVATLEASGWDPPDLEVCPTGREYVRRYLEPLADTPKLAGRIRTGVRVLAVGREGGLKGDGIGDPARARLPFRLLLESDGRERVDHAGHVIDASGVYGQANWLGNGGIPAPGERREADRIAYQLEDYLGAARERYCGQRVLLVGAGHSAATAACDLAALADEEPATQILWVTRSERVPPVQEIPDDPLAERGRLASTANHVAAGSQPAVVFSPGRTVDRLERDGDELAVLLKTGGAQGTTERVVVDRVVALVGYRPNLSMCRELQVHSCWATEGPIKLAAVLLGGSSANCLEQTSAPAASLTMPEPRFLWLGHKSYGRNPAFLLRNGFGQIRDAFRLWQDDTELDLYTATGSRT